MSKLIWVNVYDVIQHYGGAEEGGWFYDVGVPEWSQQGMCHCEALDAQAWANTGEHFTHCPIHHLWAEAKTWIEGFKPGYLDSFISKDSEELEYRGEAIHGRKEIREENSPAHAYPEHPPHYE
jgi:hypothetical protein